MSEFPAIVEGSGDLAAFLSAEKNAIDDSLANAGAILFRGFDVADAEAFDAAVRGYGDDGFTYEESLSNAVRVNVTERVFTANEAPPSTEIHMHHEMAQTPLYPSKLFFYCQIAPDEGGETPLCRSDWLLQQMAKDEPKLVARFAELGVRYSNVMPVSDDAESGQGRSWRSTLGVDDRSGAEERLSKLGYDWEWQKDESLRVTTPVLPAIRKLEDGRSTFFNQLIAAFVGWSDARNKAGKSVTFGDGTPVTSEHMGPALKAAKALAHDLAWQAGDVALIDNFLVMHGRRPFAGKRRVLASLIG